jgi:hypothetical protein
VTDGSLQRVIEVRLAGWLAGWLVLQLAAAVTTTL